MAQHAALHWRLRPLCFGAHLSASALLMFFLFRPTAPTYKEQHGCPSHDQLVSRTCSRKECPRPTNNTHLFKGAVPSLPIPRHTLLTGAVPILPPTPHIFSEICCPPPTNTKARLPKGVVPVVLLPTTCSLKNTCSSTTNTPFPRSSARPPSARPSTPCGVAPTALRPARGSWRER